MSRYFVVCAALLIAVAGCTKSDSSGADTDSEKSSLELKAAGFTETVSIKVPGMK